MPILNLANFQGSVVRGHVTAVAEDLESDTAPFFFHAPAMNNERLPLLPIRLLAGAAVSGPFDPEGVQMFFADALYQSYTSGLPGELGYWCRILADGEMNFLRIFTSESDATSNQDHVGECVIGPGSNSTWVVVHRGTAGSNDVFAWLYAPAGFGSFPLDTIFPFSVSPSNDFALRPEDLVPGTMFILESEVDLTANYVSTGGEPGLSVPLVIAVSVDDALLSITPGEPGAETFEFPIDVSLNDDQHGIVRATVMITGVSDTHVTTMTRVDLVGLKGFGASPGACHRSFVIGDFDFDTKKWLFSKQTGQMV